GRPEAAYFIERMIDRLAARVGRDPAEVRRRNFIPPDRFPYETATGTSYDSGQYARALDALLERAGYPALRAEQAAARAAGRLVGLGLASYVEMCGFVGQDTYGSRSISRGGMAAVLNARHVRDKARRIAAHLLEARVDDVVLDAGRFHVRGVPRRTVGWVEVARAAHTGRGPADLEPGLFGREDFVGQGLLYPFGSHLAMVEVDRETGAVRVLRYLTVDDSGPIVNPLLAAGQVHGGLAQGIGQALWEWGRYDPGGQLLAGSLMDYAVAKAGDLPPFDTGHTETPSPRTALGVKGIGESATIGSTPAIANAVLDALAPLGVQDLDVPLTPDAIRAVQRR